MSSHNFKSYDGLFIPQSGADVLELPLAERMGVCCQLAL
jgi:hypothetical protein